MIERTTWLVSGVLCLFAVPLLGRESGGDTDMNGRKLAGLYR